MSSPAFGRRDEHGFSLIELMVVLSLISLVVFTLYNLLDSMTKNASRQQALVINQEQVRLTMLAITRDLRAANPLLPLATSPAYGNQFDAAVIPATGSGVTYVRWQKVGTSITRSILDGPNGSVQSTKVVIKQVANTSSQPLFSYYTSAGATAPLDLNSLSTLPGDVSNCAIRVRVMIAAAPQTGPSPFAEQTDAEIRNRLPGGIGC